jgi:hypothetical protein
MTYIPVIIGAFTVSQLPPASENQGKYAYVTDLGGGADTVISDGVNWKHIRRGVAAMVPAASTINVQPLITATQYILSGTGFNAASAVRISSTNIYDGYEFTLTVPNGVLGVLGSIGVGLDTGALINLPGLTGSWADFTYRNGTFMKLRGGSL